MPEQVPICLETQNLWFAYQPGTPVLKDISFQVPEGDFLAIIGLNGSGKTSLAKHFNGLLRPDRGQVLVYGEDIRGRSISELARTVGFVFQNPDHQIFSSTTSAEIAFGPRNLGWSQSEIRRRTEQVLHDFSLTPFADQQPATLSFGLRRKISIAAVYAMSPRILILDEPTTGLDRKNTGQLMELLKDLHSQGHTIVLITHDIQLVADYIPRCLVLQDGQLLLYSDTRSVLRSSRLLEETQLGLPQITQLAARMASFGLRPDILSVPEFCTEYQQLAMKSESQT